MLTMMSVSTWTAQKGVIFEVYTAADMDITAFWVIEP
jgi:hypothetical protein